MTGSSLNKEMSKIDHYEVTPREVSLTVIQFDSDIVLMIFFI